MRSTSLALLTAMLATTVPAYAQGTVLETLVINAAGLTPFEEQQLGRSYTVISSETIELTKAAYVADLLRTVPGFAVSQSSPVAVLQGH